MKKVITEGLVLALPDYAKRGIWIVFESRKLNDMERWYTVQDKEMAAIVHCQRTWKRSQFMIKTDNIETSYFQTQSNHAGLVEEGKYYFGLMKEYKIEASYQHYASIVDLLGRTGKLQEAVSIFKDLPKQPIMFPIALDPAFPLRESAIRMAMPDLYSKMESNSAKKSCHLACLGIKLLWILEIASDNIISLYHKPILQQVVPPIP
ncbi:hypothetical protein RJ640_010753 [Escallonia rubra]|uniref:Reverse transcriptase RNase H-like domain-containing protein n=1 Tax=Escallonia rubra TaxID=112253 RepID=A0AA88UWT8_9ASTE|nr:hypothetical protein RJ640_010753 [Escallonia rubra]